jgi:hypothetical protein
LAIATDGCCWIAYSSGTDDARRAGCGAPEHDAVRRHEALGVLQTANLVTVRRVGRRKLHYLNPAPIQLVLERWFG